MLPIVKCVREKKNLGSILDFQENIMLIEIMTPLS